MSLQLEVAKNDLPSIVRRALDDESGGDNGCVDEGNDKEQH